MPQVLQNIFVFCLCDVTLFVTRTHSIEQKCFIKSGSRCLLFAGEQEKAFHCLSCFFLILLLYFCRLSLALLSIALVVVPSLYLFTNNSVIISFVCLFVFYRQDRNGKEQMGAGFECCSLRCCISCHGVRIVFLLWSCNYFGQLVREL